MLHSYIVEFKYAKSKDTEAHVEQLRQEAISQVSRKRGSNECKKTHNT